MDFHHRLSEADHLTAEDLASAIDLTAEYADLPENTMVPELSCTLILPFLFLLVLKLLLNHYHFLIEYGNFYFLIDISNCLFLRVTVMLLHRHWL